MNRWQLSVFEQAQAQNKPQCLAGLQCRHRRQHRAANMAGRAIAYAHQQQAGCSQALWAVGLQQITGLGLKVTSAGGRSDQAGKRVIAAGHVLRHQHDQSITFFSAEPGAVQGLEFEVHN